MYETLANFFCKFHADDKRTETKKSRADPEGGGGQGVRTPPEKSQKYRIS